MMMRIVKLAYNHPVEFASLLEPFSHPVTPDGIADVDEYPHLTRVQIPQVGREWLCVRATGY